MTKYAVIGLLVICFSMNILKMHSQNEEYGISAMMFDFDRDFSEWSPLKKELKFPSGISFIYSRQLTRYISYSLPIHIGRETNLFNSDGKSDNLNILAGDLAVKLEQLGSWNILSPYLMTGIGGYGYNENGEGFKMRVKVPVGLGLNIKLYRRLYIRLHTSYNHEIKRNRAYYVYGAGINVKLGKDPVRRKVKEEIEPMIIASDVQNILDSDEDGVPDTLDRCPFEAGIVANFGCPLYEDITDSSNDSFMLSKNEHTQDTTLIDVMDENVGNIDSNIISMVDTSVLENALSDTSIRLKNDISIKTDSSDIVNAPVVVHSESDSSVHYNLNDKNEKLLETDKDEQQVVILDESIDIVVDSNSIEDSTNFEKSINDSTEINVNPNVHVKDEILIVVAPTKDQVSFEEPITTNVNFDSVGNRVIHDTIYIHDTLETIVYVNREDRDQDGIADDIDKCPDLKGSVTNNGCPENKKDVLDITVNVEAKSILEPESSDKTNITIISDFVNDKLDLLKFPTGIAALQFYHMDILNKVLKIMIDHPEYHLRIYGHTDNEGSDGLNNVLSTNRAKACFEYLQIFHVSTNNMTYEGMGEDHPVDDNQTYKGRSQNRRVVFEFYKKIN